MTSTIKMTMSSDYIWLVAISFLLAATMGLAQERNEIILPDLGYQDYTVEDDENNWRNATATSDNEWRAKEEESKGRIKYGYDPSYEDMQERYNDQYNSLNKRLNQGSDTAAPSQLRFDW